MTSIKFRSGGDVVDYCPVPLKGVFLSVDTVNPSTYWPGTTWSQLTGGLIALAGTTGYANVGAVGGSKKITIEQMPSHTHQAFARNWEAAGSTGTSIGTNKDEVIGSWGIQPTGGGQDYYPLHMSISAWKRIT